MQKAIDVLMGEHRLIEVVLGSLETFAERIRAGERAQREVVEDYARFFRGFADTCHHGKEEDILFQRMVERGFARDVGPLAVMYYEHDLGRAHVAGLFDAAGALDEGSRGTALLLEHADTYVPLLRQHIFKEDRILYPMALQLLEPAELDAMNGEFEAFEATMRADGSLDQLRDLGESLAGRFRPDPSRAAAAFPATHCMR